MWNHSIYRLFDTIFFTNSVVLENNNDKIANIVTGMIQAIQETNDTNGR